MDQQNFTNENQQPEVKPSAGKGFSIAALVLGIVGVVFGFIPAISFIALPCALVGLILGVMGRKKSKLALGKSSGIATAGFVLSIIGLSFAALGFICTVACIGIGTSSAGCVSSLF
ncbi:MAG: DUF4190 domain-containing protein [Clostridia bacterium]|nr:DUF4190 domain-containing protein [Clostridia bacterium]